MHDLVLDSAEALAFVDASFGGVLMKDVEEHFYLEQAFRILHEVTRVLESDAIVFTTTTKDKQVFWTNLTM